MCPVCGAIHEENRYDQEHFECIECGHVDNADHNASINIKNRVSEPCFLNLLKQSSIDGSYIPKKISHDKFKDKI